MGKRTAPVVLALALLAALPGCRWLFAPPELAIYVDAAGGSDEAGDGSQARPYRTLTHALADPRLGEGWEVRLAPGTYDRVLGEAFPISIPAGVTVVGAGPDQSRIVGPYATGDDVDAPVVIGGEGAGLVDVGVANEPPYYGVGFYSESSGRVEGCEFSHLSAGIWLQGGNCLVSGNEIHDTSLDTGIMILGDNTSQVRDNHLFDNDVGVFIGEGARPTLRGNRIENSSVCGIWIEAPALPDLGTPSSPGGNSVSGSGGYHLRCDPQLVILSPPVSPRAMEGGIIRAVGNEWEGISPTGTVAGPVVLPPYLSLGLGAVVQFSEVYQLTENARLADWLTDSDGIPFPGSPGDPDGAAVRLGSAALEDGGVYEDVLVTYPPQRAGGWIEGRYPIRIPEGAVFRAEFGFLAGAQATDGVTVQVAFEPLVTILAMPSVILLFSEQHGYEGELLPIEVDLSSLAGELGILSIRVEAGPSGDHDWSAWVDPRVYSPAP